MRDRKESGQAILLVVLAMGLLLIGALGLVMDGAQIYTNREMAQLAADAAAEAGIMSVYNGTNTGTNAFGSSSHTCTTSDAITPCQYARFNGFGSTAADTVVVDFPGASAVGVAASSLSSDSPNIVRVTINRTLNTSLMRLLGASTATVKAIGAAAILDVISPIPILVLHPTLPGSFSMNGNIKITICGGAARSIQVDSDSGSAVSISGNSSVVDLSHAGPKDPGDCSLGTGSDFAVTGGQTAYGGGHSVCAGTCQLDIGTTGHYLSAVSYQQDPFAGIAQPSTKPSAGTQTNITATCDTAGNPACGPTCARCGCAIGSTCTEYTAGYYPNIDVHNSFALFEPGLYWVDCASGCHGSVTGFTMESNSGAEMTTGVSGSGDYSNNGMMVFLTGSATLSVAANAGGASNGSFTGISLVGSAAGGTFKNILFFGDRTVDASQSFGGGGNISLQGTFYFTNPTTHNQIFNFGGGSGGNTILQGEIIVDQLALSGGGSGTNIKMNLSPLAQVTVRQVALVH